MVPGDWNDLRNGSGGENGMKTNPCLDLKRANSGVRQVEKFGEEVLRGTPVLV